MNGREASISWKTHDSVLIVTIDHQRRRNALNPEAHQCLADVFDEFSSDARIQVAIITGSGDKAFCSGSDLSVEAGLNRESLPRSGFGGGLVLASNDGDVGTAGYDTFGAGLYYSPESIDATFSVAYDTKDPETGSDSTDFFIGVDYLVGPGTLHAAYNSTDVDDNSDNTDQTGYEVSYSYAVNDNVTVRPGIFTVEENDGTNDDSGVLLETTFSF